MLQMNYLKTRHAGCFAIAYNEKKMEKDQMAIANTVTKESVIIEVLNKLKSREYKLNFRRETTCLYCFQSNEWIMPEDFTVDKYYYFEDILNPDAERMLYAISVTQGRKGFLIDACSVYADNISQEMMEKLKWNNTRSRKISLSNAGEIKEPIKLINEALAF